VRLFGWDIHAPGVLSNSYFTNVQPAAAKTRIALYLPPDVRTAKSHNKGGKTADPQTYHIGEALEPMMLEAFQYSFDELILIEAEPTPEIMQRYAIPYLVTVRFVDFQNDVTWKGQKVALRTSVVVMDRNLSVVERFDSLGASDAQKVFAKKGGPEINLNAAIENNVRAIIEHLQDSLVSGKWKETAAP
jgi:hypothetical protein